MTQILVYTTHANLKISYVLTPPLRPWGSVVRGVNQERMYTDLKNKNK